MKKVILSSFHSCSLHALECEGVEPDRILSFDSHIDTNLLGVLEEVLFMIDDNRSLRYALSGLQGNLLPCKRHIVCLLLPTSLCCHCGSPYLSAVLLGSQEDKLIGCCKVTIN
ncbi:MAG: hypothetical protein WBZ36_04910 [Candidatus Nitrosopolaris sp.]